MKPHYHPSASGAPMLIRAGCHLCYEAPGPVQALLLIAPQAAPGQILLQEKTLVAAGSPVTKIADPHGNLPWRVMLAKGRNEIRHDALLRVDHRTPASGALLLPAALPDQVLRYTMPSRYCESDKIAAFAQERFGHFAGDARLPQAICDWVHTHVEYRYGSGSPHLSAFDILQRRFGVCRDFAHLMIALCRALDLPARYTGGHLPFTGEAHGDIGVDFHAYCEVYTAAGWQTWDPRHGRLYPGRIRVAHGMDATDTAIATIYGEAKLTGFSVWSYQVDEGASLDDPVLISRDDNGSARLAA